MTPPPQSECYGDNCKGCDYYNRCGYIKISDPFKDAELRQAGDP
jgi:hypothetical protein